MSSHRQWARAFATQARADLDARRALLKHPDVPACEQLHFLQMVCEKLAKAHLYRNCSLPQHRHDYTAKNLPLILRDVYVRLNRKKPSRWLFQEIRRLAREIELLAPGVDAAGSRPDNCEYPWEDAAGRLHVPTTHDFAHLNLVGHPAGVEILKLLPYAVSQALTL